MDMTNVVVDDDAIELVDDSESRSSSIQRKIV
jgi:hypothetical protein